MSKDKDIYVRYGASDIDEKSCDCLFVKTTADEYNKEFLESRDK